MVSLVYGHVVCILCPDGHESEPNLCGEINSTDTFQFVEEENSTPQIETVDHHDDASVAAALAREEWQQRRPTRKRKLYSDAAASRVSHTDTNSSTANGSSPLQKKRRRIAAADFESSKWLNNFAQTLKLE